MRVSSECESVTAIVGSTRTIAEITNTAQNKGSAQSAMLATGAASASGAPAMRLRRKREYFSMRRLL